MGIRKPYRKRRQFHVIAVQLDLQDLTLEHRKWGAIQRAKAGDWLVDNAGDVYTVDKEYFREHYQRISPGVYEKVGAVWAEVAASDGVLSTLEGSTAYKAGDYLVFDREQGGEGYAVPRLRFERMYEEIDPEIRLSKEQKRYIDERIRPRMEAFRRKARHNRRAYHAWQTMAIVAASMVPVFSVFAGESMIIKSLVAVFGGASAIIVGILGLFKYQENWIRYHTIYHELDSVLSQFELGLGEYADRARAFERMAENCENILKMEIGQRANTHRQETEDASVP